MIDKLVRVALCVPLYSLFDYKISPSMPTPVVGSRVLVPFGSRTLIGFVVAIIDQKDSDIDPKKLKFIKQLPDQNSVIISPQTFALAHWLANYYHYPLGDTLSVMLPTLFKTNQPIHNNITLWQAFDDTTTDHLAQTHKLTPAQKKALNTIKHLGKLYQYNLKTHAISPKVLDTLTDKGFIYQSNQPACPPSLPRLNAVPQILTDEQALAVTKITTACNDSVYKAFLLNGVTGSGKTEVYLQAMTSVLQKGKQVLVLIPEIGLSPQTLARFHSRFLANILVLHSKLSDKERFDGYKACQNGTAQIIIGTRSSVLCDFNDLGLIIIDEAHDPSYKQQDHLRYHACYVAMYVAMIKKIPIVLGTATPTTQMLHLCQTQKMQALYLTRRATGQPPAMYLIDKRTHGQAVYHNQHTSLTQTSINAIFKTLNQGKQVLIFINKRGFSPVLMCTACGFLADCPRCDSHLTVHKKTLNPSYRSNFLKCHHCQYQTAIFEHCPDCGSPNIETIGVGTTRLFEELHSIFANPQTSKITYPILQIDRDTTQKKQDWQMLYDTINTAKPMILVGTQMLAKGHHFDNVALVVVADIDSGFFAPNILASETTCALITQVAGRAGRGGAGKVLIETYKPDNPLLKQLIKDGYMAVAKQILAERQLLGLPPITYAVVIKSQANSEHNAKQAIITLKNSLPPNDFAVLAPLDTPLTKKNNQYFCQMLILSKSRQTLHAFLHAWWQTALASTNTKLSLDIDPLGW